MAFGGICCNGGSALARWLSFLIIYLAFDGSGLHLIETESILSLFFSEI